MEIIRSYENKKVKHVSKLKDKSYRFETEQYFAEGLKWVSDALKSDTSSDIIDYILVKETKISEYMTVLGDFERIYAVADNIFDRISETQNNQGILAVLRVKKNSGMPIGNRILYLDRIRDPGNMGTIIRTACAAGYSEIVCDDCVDSYNPKVVRSCMSAILHVNIYSAESTTLESLKKCGYAVIAADADGENVFELRELPEKLTLVIGNEAEGVSKEISAHTDKFVAIPMSGNIESLNAAVSAAVLMYNLKNNKGE